MAPAVFSAVSTENKYGVPAALRLLLQSGIGRWFSINTSGGEALTLAQLPIKTLITVSGIRMGKLPHPLEFYKRLTAASPKRLLNPLVLPQWIAALWEFATHPRSSRASRSAPTKAPRRSMPSMPPASQRPARNHPLRRVARRPTHALDAG